MNIREKGPNSSAPPVESLKGKDLDQAFIESFWWLRRAVYDYVFPNKCLSFKEGRVILADPDKFIFEVRRNIGTKIEIYKITSEGLSSLETEDNAKGIDSSILGELPYKGDDRYYLSHVREEKTAIFGTAWLTDESERNPFAKQAMEEKKRAAIKVVRWCQEQPAKSTFNGHARI